MSRVRWHGREVQGRIAATHQQRKFGMHDADQRLTRGQAADDFMPEGLVLDPGDEVAHHRQRDVGFQQRHAHFAQRLLNVGLGEPRLTSQRLDYAREAPCQVVEHG